MNAQYCKPWEKGLLRVTHNKRYLINGDEPFFWLGDTAWGLFRCLDADQTYTYFKNRVEKGFTVIQCVLLQSMTRKRMRSGFPTPSGISEAISEGNEVFWKHVDKVMDMAEEMGLYLAVLPTWGSVVGQGFLNMDNLPAYSDFIIKRYGSRPNIIWILGGDIRGGGNYDVWDAFGKTLKERCPDRLVGYHPFGRTSSSYWFNDCDWLDINLFQSGHRRYDQRNLSAWDDEAAAEPWHGEDSWRYVEHDLALNPCRPVLDGEPSYEQVPQGLHDAGEPRWQDYHVRRYAYWSVLAGACGHTYGHNAVFQFFGSVFSPPGCCVNETWEEAIHHPGAGQMTVLKALMQEISWSDCEPLDAVMDKGRKHGYVQAFGNEKNMLFYNWTGRYFACTDERYKKAEAYWIDPASGSRSYFGFVDISDGKAFAPPKKPEGQHNDWILLLKNII